MEMSEAGKLSRGRSSDELFVKRDCLGKVIVRFRFSESRQLTVPRSIPYPSLLGSQLAVVQRARCGHFGVRFRIKKITKSIKAEKSPVFGIDFAAVYGKRRHPPGEPVDRFGSPGPGVPGSRRIGWGGPQSTRN